MLMTCTGMLLWVWGFNSLRLGLIVLAEFGYLSAGLIAIFYENKFSKLSIVGKLAVGFYIFFYFYCFLVSFLGDSFHTDYVSFLFWDSGFFFIGIGCLAFVGAKKSDFKIFVSSYLLFFLLDLLITGRYLDPSVAFAGSNRAVAFKLISDALGHAHQAYQLHVILSSLALLSFAFSVEFIKERLWIIISFLPILAMIFLGMFYQKRNVFLEIGFFGVFYALIPSFKILKRGLYFKTFAFLFLIFCLSFYFLNDLFKSGLDLVLERFLNSGNVAHEGYSSNERIAETQFFLDQYDLVYHFIGRGLTSFVPDTEGYNSMHLGAGNFILKGGYIMLFSVTCLLLLNIGLGVKKFFLSGDKMLLWISSFSLFSFYTYLSMWGWFPNIMYLPIALFLYDIYQNYNLKTA